MPTATNGAVVADQFWLFVDRHFRIRAIKNRAMEDRATGLLHGSANWTARCMPSENAMSWAPFRMIPAANSPL
jgi:hypothetical protein